MTTIYACTRIEKTAEESTFAEGCIGERVVVMSEGCNLQADSLSGLLTKICKRYYLKLDSVFLPEDNGPIDYFQFNCMETNEGDEPSEREMDQWKAGEFALYLADYTFQVEKRIVEPALAEEFRAAGINCND